MVFSFRLPLLIRLLDKLTLDLGRRLSILDNRVNILMKREETSNTAQDYRPPTTKPFRNHLFIARKQQYRPDRQSYLPANVSGDRATPNFTPNKDVLIQLLIQLFIQY